MENHQIFLKVDISWNSYLGANSLVATDATCFMAWIAAQYGLKLPKHYKMKDRCFKGVGDKTDINKKSCS